MRIFWGPCVSKLQGDILEVKTKTFVLPCHAVKKSFDQQSSHRQSWTQSLENKLKITIINMEIIPLYGIINTANTFTIKYITV
jgi:hypothetical protein